MCQGLIFLLYYVVCSHLHCNTYRELGLFYVKLWDSSDSESLFRTLKYRPEYPEKGFEDLEVARTWMNDFVRWYNCEHLHSSIKFVTPEDRHTGKDSEVLEGRKSVYLNAQAERPERWSGEIRNWDHIKEVFLNPDKQKPGIEKDDKAA